MKTSEKRIGGYAKKGRRLQKAAVGESCQVAKTEAAAEAVQEMTIAIVRILMKAQREAIVGKRDAVKFVAAMQDLRQFIEKKVKKTAGKPDSRRRNSGRA